MSFHDIRFPVDISLGSSGGPERRTDIITLASGHEERNTQWQSSRRRYNAGYGIRSLDDIHKIIHFFECRRGRLHGFRWRDPTDWKSCAPSAEPSHLDQLIGIGDSTKKNFPLTKTYHSTADVLIPDSNWMRIIKKPVWGQVKIAVNGIAQIAARHFTLDPLAGEVRFHDEHVPAPRAQITAGFEFDVPVRFDTDYLEIDLAAFRAGQIPDIPLVEIRL